MPRTLRPDAYGPEYEELLLVASRNKGYTMTLRSPHEAYCFRIKLYAYFKALRTDAATSIKSARLAVNAEELKLSIVNSDLLISMRRDSWDAEAIRHSLNLPPVLDAQVPENSASLLSKLSLIRKRNLKD